MIKEFYKILQLFVLVVSLYFWLVSGKKTHEPDCAKNDFCKARTCVMCETKIGCCGYEYTPSLDSIMGPSESYLNCKRCAKEDRRLQR